MGLIDLLIYSAVYVFRMFFPRILEWDFFRFCSFLKMRYDLTDAPKTNKENKNKNNNKTAQNTHSARCTSSPKLFTLNPSSRYKLTRRWRSWSHDWPWTHITDLQFQPSRQLQALQCICVHSWCHHSWQPVSWDPSRPEEGLAVHLKFRKYLYWAQLSDSKKKK